MVVGVATISDRPEQLVVFGRQSEHSAEVAVVILGRTYCKVDARFSRIDVGDPLTTSRTVGHAMKATDTGKSLGARIGRALSSLASGLGVIEISVAVE